MLVSIARENAHGGRITQRDNHSRNDARLVRTACSRAHDARYRRDRRGIATLAPIASPYALEAYRGAAQRPFRGGVPW